MPDALSPVFHALADPTRREILQRLALGETTVRELSRPFTISAPAISRHLRVLEEAGLITTRKEKQWKYCRLNPGSLIMAAEWFERYRHFWETGGDTPTQISKAE